MYDFLFDVMLCDDRRLDNFFGGAYSFHSLMEIQFSIDQVDVLRKIEAVRKWEICVSIKRRLLRHAFHRKGAAITIAIAYQNFVLRDRLKALLHWSRVMGAIDFQRLYRAHVARKYARKLKAELKRVRDMRTHSAIVIQSGARVYLARCQLHKLFDQRREKIQQRKSAKLARMQEKVSIDLVLNPAKTCSAVCIYALLGVHILSNALQYCELVLI